MLMLLLLLLLLLLNSEMIMIDHTLLWLLLLLLMIEEGARVSVGERQLLPQSATWTQSRSGYVYVNKTTKIMRECIDQHVKIDHFCGLGQCNDIYYLHLRMYVNLRQVIICEGLVKDNLLKVFLECYCRSCSYLEQRVKCMSLIE